jgi:outer membrane protein TolC
LPPVDLLSYETRVASLEEDVQNALAEELRRAIELARLTGDPSVGTKRADAARAPPDGGGIGPDVRARVLSSSFELSQQRAVVRLAEVQARTAENPYRPRLDLEGYLQAQGLGNREVLPAFSQLAGLGAVSAFVSLTYEAPLDSTRREREREKADMAIAAAKARLTALEQKLIASLDNAVTQVASADSRIALAERTRVIAEQQLDAENARYVTGSGTALQVREAEDSVRSARLREVRARADRIEARLTIEHLSGTLLARRSGASPRNPPSASLPAGPRAQQKESGGGSGTARGGDLGGIVP